MVNSHTYRKIAERDHEDAFADENHVCCATRRGQIRHLLKRIQVREPLAREVALRNENIGFNCMFFEVQLKIFYERTELFALELLTKSIGTEDADLYEFLLHSAAHNIAEKILQFIKTIVNLYTRKRLNCSTHRHKLRREIVKFRFKLIKTITLFCNVMRNVFKFIEIKNRRTVARRRREKSFFIKASQNAIRCGAIQKLTRFCRKNWRRSTLSDRIATSFL